MIPKIPKKSSQLRHEYEARPVSAMEKSRKKWAKELKKEKKKRKSKQKNLNFANASSEHWRKYAMSLDTEFAIYRHQQLHRDTDGYAHLIPKKGGKNDV